MQNKVRNKPSIKEGETPIVGMEFVDSDENPNIII